MSEGRSSIVLPLLALVGAMATFQSGAAVAKSLFPAVGAEGAAALRLSLGAIMLLALVRPWRAWPKRAPVWLLAGLGAAMGLTILFFYLALSRLPLGVAISLQFLGPLTVAVVGSRRMSDLLWAALAAGGVWLLVGLGARLSRPDLLGVGFALAAAAGWAAYIVIGRITSAAFGHATAALAVAIAAVVVFPVGLAHAGPHALFSLRILPLALLVGALSAAIPFSLELYALARMPARAYATFTSIEPAFGVIAGFVLLHQRLSLEQIGGVALVAAAAAGAAWTSSAGLARAEATPTPN